MDIVDIAEKAKSKEDFAEFLRILSSDFRSNSTEWENVELEKYLEAMARFLNDSSDQSINSIDFTPSWSLFARIMIAASVYE